MPKMTFFYFFITGIVIAISVLSLAASGVLFKKQVNPAATSLPVVKAPSITEEKASLLDPAPPVLQQPTPVSVITDIPVAEKDKVSKYEFQKGMIYIAWTENGYGNVSSPKSMEQMALLGINWAGLVTTWYQNQYNSTTVYPLKDKTSSDESLIFAIRKLHELKFKIMLKPHLDLIEGKGKWRGEIGFNNAAGWQAWFDSYTAFILHYAEIAANENVELFCIGTELSNSTTKQPQAWRDLINKIREIYKGQLTYAANWDNEYKQISFWDALDYAGIDPYFPLVTTARPAVEQLKEAWLDWAKVIEEWQKNINKPVIFTEIGYKSARDAADEPWQHNAIGELDLGLQANLYKGLLESFWDKPWFYGVYWWYWGANPKMGGELNRGFTPQNKPAQEVIKEWYGKEVPQKSY